MSNRRQLPEQDPVSAFIASMDGARIPGGCDACDAYQVVRAMQGHPKVHTISVYHDDDCPRLAAISARRQNR